MKKIALISLTYLLVNFAFSQTIVPTTVTKKVAILEEYTGIHCTWCPSAHGISNTIAGANPDKFYAINIHQGSLSVPSGSEPDFRTPWGDPLADKAGAKNYPIGSINRRTFDTDPSVKTTVKARSTWAGHVNTVIAEDSPVNIAINASLDPTTKELTVLVELYYTDSAAAVNTLLENYLTVVVLQDNILGPQIGKEKNPAAVRGNLYNHTHMLRTLLTKLWGDTIKVRKGFVTKTITHTVPANYEGIPVKLDDLSVVAFITKTKTEIFTGAKDSDLLPSTSFAGLTATYTNPTAKEWCTSSAALGNVELTVTNGGMFTITDFKASLTPIVSHNTPPNKVVSVFSGNLAPNQSTKLTFPLANQNGISSFSFPAPSILYDVKATGNQTKINKATIAGPTPSTIVDIPSTKVTSFPFLVAFEGDSGTVPSTVYRTSDLNHPYIDSSRTADIGGLGRSKKSLRFNFYSLVKGVEASIVLQKLDLSSFTTTQAGLRFAYAYTSGGNEPDSLSVDISTDCGVNWTSIWSKKGNDLITTPRSRIEFVPTANQWKEVALPLNSYAQSDVLIRFKGVSGYGNNLYIDDIKISPQVLSTNELFSGKNSFTIFPNPASSQITLSLIQDEANKAENKTVTIRIFDITGRNVFKSSTTTEKLRNYKVKTQEFTQGVYFVEISSDNQNKITKLVIQ